MWIKKTDRLPGKEPHRNVEIKYRDAANKEFTAIASSRLINIIDCTHWREIEQSPE